VDVSHKKGWGIANQKIVDLTINHGGLIKTRWGFNQQKTDFNQQHVLIKATHIDTHPRTIEFGIQQTLGNHQQKKHLSKLG